MEEDKVKEKDNGGEQSTGEKVQEGIQDTANAVKDGASLAKNVASQNYVGVAKDALNLLKNKKVRRLLLLSAIVPILIIVMIVGSIFAIFNSIGETIENVINDYTQWVANNYTFGIIYYDDEQIDKIIDAIEASGISLDDLSLMGDIDYNEDDPDREEKERKALRKYLLKFLIAQEKMRVLNPRPDGGAWELDYVDDKLAQASMAYQMLLKLDGQSLTYGNVYVHRIKDNLTEVSKNNLSIDNQLKYLYYETFEEMVQNNNSDCLRHFSVDNSGNMVYAKEIQINKADKGYWGNAKLDQNSEEKKYEIIPFNYQSMVSQYVTSTQFFLYLTMVTQNPEFVAEVADLAAEGEIRIAIMDNTETITENSTSDYIMNFKELKENENGEYEQEYSDKEYHLESTVTTKTNNPQVEVIYAKTWYAEREITYTKTDVIDEGELEQDEEPDETEPSWDSMNPGDSNHWVTGIKKSYQKTTNKTKYEESANANVVDKTDTIIEMLDKKYKIPNTTREEAPAENFVSGAEWLCELLKLDTYSQNMEQVVRYILNKYTHSSNYGEINIDELITDAVTIDLSGDYFQEGGIKTEEQRKRIQAKIEKELLNTKVHRDSTYQTGPFAEWWTLPKNSGLLYQCPWWVYGRAQMYLEKIGSTKTRSDLYKIYGNGADWYDKNIANKQFNYGSVPKPNSIISWKGGTEGCGHVAYVEGVTDDGIYISHAGNGTSWFGITKIGLDGNPGWSGYTLNGYIYLDEPIT